MQIPATAQLEVLCPLAQASGGQLLTVLLCALAGIGTYFMLPGRREAAIGRIGGVIVLVAGLIAMAALIRAAAVTTTGDVYFWIFSFIALAGAVRVITHPKPVYSALYFVLTVLASAGLFVLLWAEFMAAALVLIYAGAILVTYVFVIMLAQQAHGGSADEVGGAEYDLTSREPLIACAIGFTMMAVLLDVIFNRGGAPSIKAAAAPGEKGLSIQDLAAFVFSDQLVNLELAGVILTLAMVGAIVIARRRVSSETAVMPEQVTMAATPVDDNPHSIPVEGTTNPRAKAYPEQ